MAWIPVLPRQLLYTHYPPKAPSTARSGPTSRTAAGRSTSAKRFPGDRSLRHGRRGDTWRRLPRMRQRSDRGMSQGGWAALRAKGDVVLYCASSYDVLCVAMTLLRARW